MQRKSAKTFTVFFAAAPASKKAAPASKKATLASNEDNLAFCRALRSLAGPFLAPNSALPSEKGPSHPAKRMKVDTIGSLVDPPSQRSPANIMNALNDDCLMELFDRLHTRDLYSVAYVCKRFRSMATKVFHCRFTERLFGWEQLQRSLPVGSKVTLSLFVDFIRIFSPTNVQKMHKFNENVVLQSMAAYCPNLRELDITSDQLDARTLATLRPILPKLRELLMPATNILNGCADIDWHLEELYIFPVERPVMPTIRTPRLAKVIFADRKPLLWTDGPKIREFLARNQQVTTVELLDCKLSWSEWCLLAECTPNIQELKMEAVDIERTDSSTDDHVPGTFHRLTSCVLSSYSNSQRLVDLLFGAPLKRFELCGFKSDENHHRMYPIDAICQLKTITCLHLSLHFDDNIAACINDGELTRLVGSLGNLEDLFIEEGRFTLCCIEKILSTAKLITKFDVGLVRNVEVFVEPALLDRISAIVVSRPELHLEVHVRRKCIRVSGKLMDFGFE